MPRHEESRYIENILADPRNSGPRLAYADWLKDQGDQQREEYLRIQCQQRHFVGQDEDFWESRQGRGKRRTTELQVGSANDDKRTICDRLRQLEKELDPGWLIWILEDFAVPPSLSERGRHAAKTILSVLVQNKTAETGGVSLFRSPQWGQEGGLIKESSLVVLIAVYDVWLQTYFESVPHRINSQSHEMAMERALRKEGFFAESDGLGRAYIVDTATERSKPLV
jgi:uncharacterized protein (TIGR02996 family)